MNRRETPCFLQKSPHGIYYFRMAVPRDLRSLARKTELKYSLQTRCKSQADHGLTDQELTEELQNYKVHPQAAQISAAFWFRFLIRDRRFKVASNNLVWLRDWQSPNRMSMSEAVKSVLEDANRPLSREEIASRASKMAERELSINAVSAELRQLGARYSESGRVWVAPD